MELHILDLGILFTVFVMGFGAGWIFRSFMFWIAE